MPDQSQPLPGMSRTPRDGDGRGDGRTLARCYPLAVAPAWLRWSRCPRCPQSRVSPIQGVRHLLPTATLQNLGCPLKRLGNFRQFSAIFYTEPLPSAPLSGKFGFAPGLVGRTHAPLPQKTDPDLPGRSHLHLGTQQRPNILRRWSINFPKSGGGKAGPAPPGPPRHRVPPALKEPFHSYHFFFNIFAFFFLNRSLSEIVFFFFFLTCVWTQNKALDLHGSSFPCDRATFHPHPVLPSICLSKKRSLATEGSSGEPCLRWEDWKHNIYIYFFLFFF